MPATDASSVGLLPYCSCNHLYVNFHSSIQSTWPNQRSFLFSVHYNTFYLLLSSDGPCHRFARRSLDGNYDFNFTALNETLGAKFPTNVTALNATKTPLKEPQNKKEYMERNGTIPSQFNEFNWVDESKLNDSYIRSNIDHDYEFN